MISIIIPTYNRPDLLREALVSILSQTYDDFEVIVVDDGSRDNILEAVEEFNNEKLIYLRQENSGVANARNNGISVSKGEYVAFLDHDDIWLPYKLQAQKSCLDKHPEVDFIFTNFNALFDESKRIIPSYIKKQYSIFSKNNLSFDDIFEFKENFSPEIDGKKIGEGTFYWGNIFSNILLGNFGLISSRLVRREALDRVGGFLSNYPITNDYEHLIRLARNGIGGYINIPCLNYRVRSNSISHASENAIKKWIESIEIVELALEDEKETFKKNPQKYKDNLASFHNEIACLYDMRNDRGKAIEHWKTSLSLQPSGISSYMGLFLGSLLPTYLKLRGILKRLLKPQEV